MDDDDTATCGQTMGKIFYALVMPTVREGAEEPIEAYYETAEEAVEEEQVDEAKLEYVLKYMKNYEKRRTRTGVKKCADGDVKSILKKPKERVVHSLFEKEESPEEKKSVSFNPEVEVLKVWQGLAYRKSSSVALKSSTANDNDMKNFERLKNKFAHLRK